MQFKDAFPEQTVAPPQLPGQPIYSPSVLSGLRLQQLKDLAYAFDITIKKDGTKPEILPALLMAEQEGIFVQPPKRPEYVVKASRSTDDPPVDWQAHAAPSGLNFRQLQKLAKDNNIDSFGKGAEALTDELKAAGVL